MRTIYSFDNHLYLSTGAHRVLVDIHNALKNSYNSIILGTIQYENVNKSLGIKKEEYRRLSNPFILRGNILFVHQRRLAIFFILLNQVLFLKAKIIYVHHNILKGNRSFSIFPRRIITISDRCVDNLNSYFGVPLERITKIYNAVIDNLPSRHAYRNREKIKVLYPATIYHVKQQVLIVEYLKQHLNYNIEIIFAGNGEDYEKLKQITEGDDRFTCLGFVDNIKELLIDVDYCMLFSKFEGLPISLIEATMMGVPIICNDVGGNLEIANEGYNAFICNNLNELAQCLNKLQNISKSEYETLSSNSRKKYLENFTFDIFRQKYVQYIKEIDK